MELKEKLLSLGIFENNEYLDKYCDLVMNNLTTSVQKGITNSHHIIPVYYFRFKKIPVNSSKQNMVNLIFTDHIKAHYYLEKCSVPEFKGKNIFAIFKLCGTDIGKIQLEKLDNNLDITQLLEDKPIYFSEEHRKSLREGAKNRTSKNGHVSESGYAGGVTGLKMIHTPEGKRTYVEESLIPELLKQGYSIEGESYHKPENFNQSAKFREEQRQRLLDYYKTNPNFKTRSKKKVRIFKDDVEYIFNSVTEAERFMEISEKHIGKGSTAFFVRNGKIMDKKLKLYDWNIEYYEGGDNNEEVAKN